MTRLLSTVLIIGLGLAALYFGVKYNQLKKLSDSYLVEKNEINKEYDQLSTDFEGLRMEFQELEDSNYVLSGDLESKRLELIQQKEKISQLLRKERLSRTELDQARAMIQELKNEKTALLAQVKALGEENMNLKVENQNYSKTLTAAYKEKEQLVAKQDSLVTETTQLKEVNTQLAEVQKQNAPKVAFSQVIPVKSIAVSGVKYRNSGKEVETSNNRRVDKIKINFTVEKNPVAENGPKEYLVRVLAPSGIVVYDRERGSGEFIGSEKNEGMKYTTKTNIEYDGTEKNVSLFWRQDQVYEEGVYTIEVYNRGYLVGKSTLELK